MMHEAYIILRPCKEVMYCNFYGFLQRIYMFNNSTAAPEPISCSISDETESKSATTSYVCSMTEYSKSENGDEYSMYNGAGWGWQCAREGVN